MSNKPDTTNQFPLHQLKTSEKHYVMVDLKNGETLNGTLESIDKFMNLRIKNGVLTSKDGKQFLKEPEVFIKGNSLKGIRLVEGLLDKALKDAPKSKYGMEKAMGRNDKKDDHRRSGGGAQRGGDRERGHSNKNRQS